MRIGNISCRKNSGNFCTGTITFRDDITHFVRINVFFKYFSIRLMSDSQEETVDRQAITFFIRFTPTFHQVYTFYPIIAKQTNRIVFKKNFNLLVVHYSLLHNLRCTQKRFADNQIYFGCKSGKINSFFTRCITATDYSYNFLTIEKSVTSSASTYPHSGIFLLILQSQIFSSSSGSNNQ